MTTHQCSKCHTSFEKHLLDYRYKGNGALFKDRLGRIVSGNICYDCRLKKRRKASLKRGQAYTRAYRRTPKGMLMQCYVNMKGRVEGRFTRTNHLYKGLKILPKHVFYEWSLRNKDFIRLLSEYRKTGFKKRGNSPSIDRIDPSKGYVLGNIQWISLSENIARSRR